MCLAQVGGGEAVEHGGGGGADVALFRERGDLAQDVALLRDVGGLVERPGEHEFPMQAQAFAFERIDIERGGIVN